MVGVKLEPPKSNEDEEITGISEFVGAALLPPVVGAIRVCEVGSARFSVELIEYGVLKVVEGTAKLVGASTGLEFKRSGGIVKIIPDGPVIND